MSVNALYTAATGMNALQSQITNIANNMSNSGTAGFMSQKIVFEDLLYNNEAQVGGLSSDSGTISPVGIQLGAGVRVAGTYRTYAGQSLKNTDSATDMAIGGNGRGFFLVQMPDGTTSYTRNGHFSLSNNGTLVDVRGNPLIPNIVIPPNNSGFTIDKSGQVSVSFDGQPAPQVVGQIQLATFANISGLEAIGGNKFRATDASGPATVSVPGQPGVGTILQRFVNTSNNNSIEGVTNMVHMQQIYTFLTKVMNVTEQQGQELGRVGS